jgi:hypothetical protein
MPEKGRAGEGLKSLEARVQELGNSERPPLESWNPPLSGDIDIEIRADGSWWHEGTPIPRPAIVRLFASILRREDDGDYYLVTPVEKWRLRVEAHPLVVTDVDCEGAGEQRLCRVTLNTGEQVPIDNHHPLFLDSRRGGAAGVRLPHGLSAVCNRAAWYRLVEAAGQEDGRAGIVSGGRFWPLE